MAQSGSTMPPRASTSAANSSRIPSDSSFDLAHYQRLPSGAYQCLICPRRNNVLQTVPPARIQRHSTSLQHLRRIALFVASHRRPLISTRVSPERSALSFAGALPFTGTSSPRPETERVEDRGFSPLPDVPTGTMSAQHEPMESSNMYTSGFSSPEYMSFKELQERMLRCDREIVLPHTPDLYAELEEARDAEEISDGSGVLPCAGDVELGSGDEGLNGSEDRLGDGEHEVEGENEVEQSSGRYTITRMCNRHTTMMLSYRIPC